MIPFVDLKAQYRQHQARGRTPRSRASSSRCQFTLGSEVAAFEEEFAAYCGAKHGIGVNTGTSALHLALLAAGIGPGDEVITVPFTFVATVSAIHYTGATPVFVDIDPETFTMDPAARRGGDHADAPRRSSRCTSTASRPTWTRSWRSRSRHGLIVIEDACQAHGAEYKGRRAGSIGDMGCFSFYPGKNLGAYGEGGMVVTDNPDYARTIRMLRDWGAEKKYQHVLKGYNYRLEGIQGAVLRVKLRHLEKWTEARRAAAARYDKLLAGSGVADADRALPHARHVYHIYAIRTADARRRGRRRCRRRASQTGIHYPIPVHLLPAYRRPGLQGAATSRTPSAPRTRCCRCRCSRS